MRPAKELIREIHRRSLWQVLGIYVAAGWVVLQVVNALRDSAGLPNWVSPFALVLLLLGLPIVLATAFVQEGAPGVDRSPAATSSDAASGPGPDSTVPTSSPAARQGAGAAEPEGGAAARGGERSRLPGEAPRGLRRLLTWPKALLGGVIAFTLLGVVTAGYMAMRLLGVGPVGSLIARGVLDERSPVLLAEFGSSDSTIARAATEAFRVDLSQSKVVRLAENSVVRQGLARMERPADARLDLPLARDLAQREGIPAVIGGQITRAGGGYLLSAELQAAGTGDVLASQRETAEDSTGLLPAVDRLSKALRERIGESYTSLRASPPLDRVTTPDLEALRKFSEAMRLERTGADPDRELSLLQEAVRLDTAFASAWRAIGVILTNNGEQRSRAMTAFEKAFEHRDRLTERERQLTIASYYQQGTLEPAKSIPAYQRLLEMDPGDFTALNNLAVAYYQERDYGRAQETIERAIRADSFHAFGYENLAELQLLQGHPDQAEATLRKSLEKNGNDASDRWYLAQLTANRGDYGGAERQLEALRDSSGGGPTLGAWFAGDLASLLATQGRLAAAHSQLAEAARLDTERGVASAVLGDALQSAWIDALVRSRADDGIHEVEAALREHPLEEMDPLDRPYAELAELSARAGDVGRAKACWPSSRRPSPPRSAAKGDWGSSGPGGRSPSPRDARTRPCASSGSPITEAA